MDTTAHGSWPGSPFPADPFASPSFDDPVANQEDWEHWLKWDPADMADPAANGTQPSSKNGDGDSPIQEPFQGTALPMGHHDGGKDVSAPPMILGDEGGVGDAGFLFGGFDGVGDSGATAAGFEFERPMLPYGDMDAGVWPLGSNVEAQGLGMEMDLSALAADNAAPMPVSAEGSNPPSLGYSPESSSLKGNSVASNSPVASKKKRGGRKRKAEVDEEPTEMNGEDGSQEDGDEPPFKKTSHNVIEKRYRNNLNDKIVELRSSVPSLRAMGKAGGKKDSEDLEGLKPAHKLNKATIMAKATEYIKHLEKRNKTMADEMTALKARLAAAETAIGKSTAELQQTAINRNSGAEAARSRHPSSSSQAGFLNVPAQQQQQQYMQTQPQPVYNRQPAPPVEAQNQPRYANARGGGGRGGMMNKVVMGAMAGVMVMEGYSDHQQQQDGDDPSSRALFSVPTQLFKRGIETEMPTSAAELSRYLALPLLKITLVAGALIYLLAPLLTWSPRRKQKPRATTVRLPHAPSLASPIEVRRKAWLTAIQTVWVPKHFLLEVVAVTCKMISLSFRRLIGSEAFNILTGASREDETARIKAWDIAIDAQLAGGDAEVSYYRLLLTLMESGTLPDSPSRLMQKAVHFRVFFWEVANAGYGNMVGFKQFTERVGKYYWDSARQQQHELVHAKAANRPVQEVDCEVELLPAHLARLVEQDCDDVLDDEMVQRAWNLAWNKPSAHRTRANAPRDDVLLDHAIRSPLDAVAAWYTHASVDAALLATLSRHSPAQHQTDSLIALATAISPPATATQVRALTARAVLTPGARPAAIVAALAALPPSPAAHLNVLVAPMPAPHDVRPALTLAKLLDLAAMSAPPAAHVRARAALAKLRFPPPEAFTLLSAVAALKALGALTPLVVGAGDAHANAEAVNGRRSLELLAADLRVWVGTGGKSVGLGKRGRGVVVERCVGVARRVGGWEVGDEGGKGDGVGEGDSGYGSGSSRRTSWEKERERVEGDVDAGVES